MHILQRAEGYAQLEAIWKNPIFQQEREIFYGLRERGPIPVLRFESDY